MTGAAGSRRCKCSYLLPPCVRHLVVHFHPYILMYGVRCGVCLFARIGMMRGFTTVLCLRDASLCHSRYRMPVAACLSRNGSHCLHPVKHFVWHRLRTVVASLCLLSLVSNFDFTSPLPHCVDLVPIHCDPALTCSPTPLPLHFRRPSILSLISAVLVIALLTHSPRWPAALRRRLASCALDTPPFLCLPHCFSGCPAASSHAPLVWSALTSW